MRVVTANERYTQYQASMERLRLLLFAWHGLFPSHSLIFLRLILLSQNGFETEHIDEGNDAKDSK